MKIVPLKDQNNKFALAPLAFVDLKVIRDACKLFGSQGSKRAKEIAAQIEKQMESIAV